MQRHKKLSARILSMALSVAMMTTMMPATVFAAEGDVPLGASSLGTSSIGTIWSFDKLEDRFVPSTGENAADHVYGLTVELGTPVEDLNLPGELTAMVARTITAPAEDEPVVDSGKPSEPAEDETIPGEDNVVDEDTSTDDTVSGNQPATPSDAEEEVKEEIKDEDVPLAPEPDEETTVTTTEQEIISVTWNSDKEFKSDVNGKFVYTAVLPEGYTLAVGVKLPQVHVTVDKQGQTACADTAASNTLLDKLLALLADQQAMIDGGGSDVTTSDEFKALAAEVDALYAHVDACETCTAQIAEGGAYYEKFYGAEKIANPEASINGKTYATLQDACKDIPFGDTVTVKVLTDVTMTDGLYILSQGDLLTTLTLDLNGKTVTITGSTTSTENAGVSCHGIYFGGRNGSTYGAMKGNLNITDSSSSPGTLTLNAYSSSPYNGYGIGTYGGSLNISKVTVNATGVIGISTGNTGVITVDQNATVNATGAPSDYPTGIGGSLTILDGTVTAIGGEAAKSSTGVNGNVTIEKGTLTAIGGKSTEASTGIGRGVTVNGGAVIATGGEAGTDSFGIGVNGSWVKQTVTINGGKLTATGGKATKGSYGILSTESNVIVDGGELDAIGGEGTDASMGIKVDNGTDGTAKITVLGGDLKTKTTQTYTQNKNQATSMQPVGSDGNVLTPTTSTTSSSWEAQETTYNATAQDKTAKIGSVKYATLQDAFDAVKDNETITVLSDLTLSEGVKKTVDSGTVGFKLDLNGKAISITGGSSNANAISLDGSGTANLTITDSAATSGSLILTGNSAVAINTNNGTLTLTGMDVMYKDGADYTGKTHLENNKIYQGETGTDTEATDIKITKAVTPIISSIAITTQPSKTTYTAGQSFDKTGMVVTATYSNNSTAAVTSYTIAPDGALATTDNKVTVSYTEDDITKSVDVTITVNNGGGGGGGGGSSSGSGGGGGGSSTTTTPTTKPTEPVSGTSNTTATVDKNGNATTTVTDKNIADAVKAAKDAASKKGVNAGEVTAVINVTAPANSNPNTVTVNLPKTVQQQVINGKIGNVAVVIDKPDIAISMNLATITEMNKQANADIALSATRTDATKLSTEAKNAIGSRPAFDLKATFNSGSKSVTNFGSGTVSVAIPYTLQNGEVAGGLYAVYVDGNGKVNYITNSSYDADAKMLRFSTNHFSVYGISYKAPVGFTDIANHWAKTDIEFVVNRGLMSGTSNTTFAPDSAMTRGMFVTALGRLASVDVNSYKTGKFTDVKTDAYYAPYVNWAADKGIVKGTTATTFAPDQSISRQEMAVMMSNYTSVLGYKVPETRDAVTFADNASIGSWAAPAVKQMQMAGILNGKNGNKFDPTGTATRGEISAMLHRYVSLIIDKATTEGWTTNDSGSGMYYKSGKAVTGAQTISGVAYNFNNYGETTRKTAVAGATVTNPALPADGKNYTVYVVKKNDWLSKIALANNCTVDEIMALNNIKNQNLIYEGQQIKIPQK